MDVAMFIGVVHLMKHPQGVSFSAFGSVIWLRPLHRCAVFRTDALQFSDRPSVWFYPDSIGEIRGTSLGSPVQEYGIFCVSEGSGRVEEGQLPRKIVKAGPQEVSNLTNSDAPVWVGGRRFSDAKPEYDLASVRVSIGSNSVGLDVVAELGERSLELIDFGMTSRELEFWSSQGVHNECSKGERSLGGNS